MRSRRAYARRHWSLRGITWGGVFLLISLALILVFNTGGTSTARAAPPLQSSDPYQLCDLIREYVSEISTELGNNDFYCVGIVRLVGTGEVKRSIKIYVALQRSEQEARAYAGEGSVESNQPSQFRWAPVQVGEYGQENWLTWNEASVDYALGFSRDCYAIIITGPSMNEGSETNLEPEAHNWASLIDAKLMARSNTCPRSSGAEQPVPAVPIPQPSGPGSQPPSAPVEKKFAIVGISCASGAQETGKAGRLVCHVATDNEPFDEPASFTWTLDNQGAGMRRKLTVDGVAQGDHIVSVTAIFRGQQYTYTSYAGWATVLDSGEAAPTFGLSASCSYNKAQNTVTCHAAPANPPANADLEYIWYRDGVLDASKTADMAVSVPNEYRTYPVWARALDRTSSIYSNPVLTSVTTGDPPLIPPAVGQAINNTLTGDPNPSKPDPVGVAGGAALVGLGLGLAALANGLLNAAPAVVKNIVTQAATSVQQDAADAVKEVRELPSVKQAEAAVTAAVRQAVVQQAVQQAASDFLGLDDSKPPAKEEKAPAPAGPKVKPADPEASHTAGVSEAFDHVENLIDFVDQDTARDKVKAMDEAARVVDNVIQANDHDLRVEQGIKKADIIAALEAKTRKKTPSTSEEPLVIPDKFMDKVIQARDHDKAQNEINDLRAARNEKIREAMLNKDLEVAPWQKEMKTLEEKLQEAIKQRDALFQSKKGKPE